MEIQKIKYYISKGNENLAIEDDLYPKTAELLRSSAGRIKTHSDIKGDFIDSYYLPKEEYDMYKQELFDDSYQYDGIYVYLEDKTIALLITKLY